MHQSWVQNSAETAVNVSCLYSNYCELKCQNARFLFSIHVTTTLIARV